jgi:hypothetical protein
MASNCWLSQDILRAQTSDRLSPRKLTEFARYDYKRSV